MENEKTFTLAQIVEFLSKYSDNVPVSHIIGILTGRLK